MRRFSPAVAVACSLVSTFALSLSQFIPILQNSTSLVALSANSTGSGYIACSGRFCDYRPVSESCENAREKIRQTPITHDYRNRPNRGSVAPLDIGLPVRYLSDNGIFAELISKARTARVGILQIIFKLPRTLGFSSKDVSNMKDFGSIAGFSMSTLYQRLLRRCKGL